VRAHFPRREVVVSAIKGNGEPATKNVSRGTLLISFPFHNLHCQQIICIVLLNLTRWTVSGSNL
jgi:hypothetical protein